MFLCSHFQKGCPRKFSSDIGRRAHIRNCIWRNAISKQNGPSRTPNRLPFVQYPRYSDLDDFSITDNFDTLNEEDYILNANEIAREIDGMSHDSHFNKYGHLSVEEKDMGRSLSYLSKKTGNEDINNILKIMRQPGFSIERFLSTFGTTKECNNLISSDMESIFKTHGFKKVTLADEVNTGIHYDVYIRSPLEVLKAQIRTASSQSTFFNVRARSEENSDFNHPMMSELGTHGAEAVKNAIINNNDEKVIWKIPSESGEISFVGMMQIYSDKSKTSLKESAFVFHPLHLTLLNFSNSHRKENIVNGKAFVAFLPVKFQRRGTDEEYIEKVMSREVRLRIIHETLHIILEEVRAACYVGFRCVDRDGIIRRCHPCIASYCCDIPEGKDMSSVKNGNTSVRNCHRCTAPTTEFHKYSNYPLRNGTETAMLIRQSIELKRTGKILQAKDLLKNYSLSDQLPWLIRFPFIGIHPSLDLHIIFTFEILHNLHLGISKDLKKLISKRLKANDLFTTALRTKAGTERSFKNVRTWILNGINRMLSHIQSTSPAKGLYIDFSNSSKDDNGNGLYGDEGRLMGMLEGKDYRSIDMVFPFIGMMVDRCCGEDINATTTNICVKYVDIVGFLCATNGDPGWNDMKLDKLEKMIFEFKRTTAEMYSKYHASGLNTEKFHLLDHIVQDIRRLGGLRCGDAGLFEYAHTMVKSAYRKGSKRKASAMDETMLNFMHDTYRFIGLQPPSNRLQPNNEGTKLQGTSTNASTKAKERDSAALVSKGKVFILTELEKSRCAWRKKRKAIENGNDHELRRCESAWKTFDDTVRGILIDVGENGSRILCRLLAEEIKRLGGNPYDYRLSRVISGYTAGREPSSLHYNNSKTDIIMKESSNRLLQRFVSGRDFYKSTALRQDCVIIANDSDQDGTESVWIGKVLLLVRFLPTKGPVTKSSIENQAEVHDESEYVFVQYFDTQSPQDKIDELLTCIRLSWATSNEGNTVADKPAVANENFENDSKWFDLIPVKCLRGVVHVVRGDYGFDRRGMEKTMDSVPWDKQFFYVNRFYHDYEGTHYEKKGDLPF